MGWHPRYAVPSVRTCPWRRTGKCSVPLRSVMFCVYGLDSDVMRETWRDPTARNSSGDSRLSLSLPCESRVTWSFIQSTELIVQLCFMGDGEIMVPIHRQTDGSMNYQLSRWYIWRLIYCIWKSEPWYINTPFSWEHEIAGVCSNAIYNIANAS